MAAVAGKSPVHVRGYKMRIGIVGRKCGMTRVFTDEGASSSCNSGIEASPNHVTQIKSVETDGYSAVQVTTGFKEIFPRCQSPKPARVC